MTNKKDFEERLQETRSKQKDKIQHRKRIQEEQEALKELDAAIKVLRTKIYKTLPPEDTDEYNGGSW